MNDIFNITTNLIDQLDAETLRIGGEDQCDFGDSADDRLGSLIIKLNAIVRIMAENMIIAPITADSTLSGS